MYHQNPDNLLFRKAAALHAPVLVMGQSELQSGLTPRGNVTVCRNGGLSQTDYTSKEFNANGDSSLPFHHSQKLQEQPAQLSNFGFHGRRGSYPSTNHKTRGPEFISRSRLNYASRLGGSP